MSLDLPLTVRIRTGRKDVDITAQVADLSFRSSIPGGFASATLTLSRPLDSQPEDIEYYARVYVYDGRNGETVWEGRLEDPGRGAGDAGEVWSITAIGPQAHAKDRVFPIIYVDTDLTRWGPSNTTTHGGRLERGELDEDTPTLECYANEGEPVPTSWEATYTYRAIRYCGQRLARVRMDHVELGTSSNYQTIIKTRTGAGGGVVVASDNWNTTPNAISALYGSAGWVDGMDVVSIGAERNVSAGVADDLARTKLSGMSVRAALKNADGTDITSGAAYTVNNIDPVEVIADLLGRYLTKYDGPNAILIGSGVDITQMAYPNGITAAEVLDDLAVFDPAYYWAAWESDQTTDLYRFEYVPWPTTVRYEADIFDGFDSPGSASELYNAVVVRWLAGGPGHHPPHWTRRTQSVPTLTDAGLTREFLIDLSDEIGSSANAIRVGDNFLAEHRYPPNAGTLKVARPILDQDTGRMVSPWEILPGHLIRVRGVLPRVDGLNPTDRDGVTVFRIVAVDFSASDATATLELDSNPRTVAHALKSLRGRRHRKR